MEHFLTREYFSEACSGRSQKLSRLEIEPGATLYVVHLASQGRRT